ncbi:MAG: transposase [Deltaproteobacteria bacterium]|nr:transposase [Deltaproteobacteria bacterium]
MKNVAGYEVRAAEVKALKPHRYEELKSSRWCLLKKPENLTNKQGAKLKELLKLRLTSDLLEHIYSKKNLDISGNTHRPFGLTSS